GRDQVHGRDVDSAQSVGLEADQPAPIEACPPGGGVKHETETMLSGDWQEMLVILHQFCATILVLKQHEGCELRQVLALQEDKRGLHSAVAEKQATCGLR